MKKIMLMNFFLLISFSSFAVEKEENEAIFKMLPENELKEQLYKSGFEELAQETNIHQELGGQDLQLLTFLNIIRKADEIYLKIKPELTREKKIELLGILLGNQIERFYSVLEKIDNISG